MIFRSMKNYKLDLLHLEIPELCLNSHKFLFGFGNWDQWWGPGNHSSLLLTNNSRGHNNYFISTNNYLKSNFAALKLKYSVSSPIKNRFNNNFYITSHFY